MNRETYIRKVKKQLDCSVKEKEEIVRDLQEIFDSGKEHGKRRFPEGKRLSSFRTESQIARVTLLERRHRVQA